MGVKGKLRLELEMLETPLDVRAKGLDFFIFRSPISRPGVIRLFR